MGTPAEDNNIGFHTATIVLDGHVSPASSYHDTPLMGTPELQNNVGGDVPEKIREMIRLYEYGDGSFRQKCLNFYRQGTFMEDYTDDVPWEGVFKHYFPTYHDLNVPQLRGYFTWRTAVRKGRYSPTSLSFAYLYLYELLNGIGTASVEESLWKMQEFETEYLDEGYGDVRMRQNLRRWLLELAIIHQLPLKTVETFTNPRLTDRDRHLAVLRDACKHPDMEVFLALSRFATGNLEASPVFIMEKETGAHLFAEIWRHTVANCHPDGSDFVTACFGSWKPYPWYPLANAVYWERRELSDFELKLNESRSFLFKDGRWFEKKYEELYFNKKLFNELLHEADRKLRLYLKLKRPLRERPEEAWAAEYVEAVIEADRQMKIEAARPKISINLDRLNHIREEAVVTRESLLTEEETVSDAQPSESSATMPGKDTSNTLESVSSIEKDMSVEGLDELHTQVLKTLLAGGDADALIRSRRLLPSVVADTLNEAFFEEIGDSILDCDGDRLNLVEDYVDEVNRLFGDRSLAQP